MSVSESAMTSTMRETNMTEDSLKDELPPADVKRAAHDFVERIRFWLNEIEKECQDFEDEGD